MRIYISLDAEGCSGLSRFAQVNYGSPEYAYGCARMTADVNAVIEGAISGGASEIVVCDGHEHGRNVALAALHPAARLYCGAGGVYCMMDGIDGGFDAALFVGYHARRGAPGLMAHTYFLPAVLNVRIGGAAAGEFGINAALAGHFGVPAVFVSGDDAVALEAREAVPGVQAAVVKYCDDGAARCLASDSALDILRETAARAVRNVKGIAPFAASPQIEIDCLHAGQAALGSLVPGVKREGCTLSIKGENYEQSFRSMLAAMYLMDTFVP